MCENFDPNRVRCDVCRTINLAKQVKHPKPDMQMYEKCSPVEKIECPRVTESTSTSTLNRITLLMLSDDVHAKPLMRIDFQVQLPQQTRTANFQLESELPLNPTCIKVCTKEEYKLRKGGKTYTPRVPYYAHGKLLYAVKAGILVGSVYFTYTQGVWGDQQTVTECIKRWQEYVRSINSRRPPTFDHCGNVIRKESTESLVAPVYDLYKNVVTSCFSGIVKFPVILKCAYIDYLKALQKKQEEDEKERKIRKRG